MIAQFPQYSSRMTLSCRATLKYPKQRSQIMIHAFETLCTSVNCRSARYGKLDQQDTRKSLFVKINNFFFKSRHANGNSPSTISYCDRFFDKSQNIILSRNAK